MQPGAADNTVSQTELHLARVVVVHATARVVVLAVLLESDVPTHQLERVVAEEDDVGAPGRFRKHADAPLPGRHAAPHRLAATLSGLPVA